MQTNVTRLRIPKTHLKPQRQSPIYTSFALRILIFVFWAGRFTCVRLAPSGSGIPQRGVPYARLGSWPEGDDGEVLGTLFTAGRTEGTVGIRGRPGVGYAVVGLAYDGGAPTPGEGGGGASQRTVHRPACRPARARADERLSQPPSDARKKSAGERANVSRRKGCRELIGLAVLARTLVGIEPRRARRARRSARGASWRRWVWRTAREIPGEG